MSEKLITFWDKLKIIGIIFTAIFGILKVLPDDKANQISGDQKNNNSTCSPNIKTSGNVSINCEPNKNTEVKPLVNSVLMMLDRLMITVTNPPTGKVTVFVNDKDISSMLFSENQSQSQVKEKIIRYKIYIFKSSPKQLNIHVGKNQVVMKFDDTPFPSFEFVYSESEKRIVDSIEFNRAKTLEMIEAKRVKIH